MPKITNDSQARAEISVMSSNNNNSVLKKKKEKRLIS